MENKNLVELKGSEKQVKWANDIRRKLIEETEEAIIFQIIDYEKMYKSDLKIYVDKKIEHVKRKAKMSSFYKKYIWRNITKTINTITDAVWWIETGKAGNCIDPILIKIFLECKNEITDDEFIVIWERHYKSARFDGYLYHEQIRREKERGGELFSLLKNEYLNILSKLDNENLM